MIINERTKQEEMEMLLRKKENEMKDKQKLKNKEKEKMRKEIIRKSRKIKKQKIAGSETYINKYTGEIQEMLVIEKNVEQDFNFFKVWIMDLMNVLELVGSKKMKVVNYILENLNVKENLFIGTHVEISKKLNISRPVVSQTFKILIDSNLLVKKNIGVYMLNPDILVKGRTGKRLNLLIKYNEIKNNNKEEE